jgi:hypothetical protein
LTDPILKDEKKPGHVIMTGLRNQRVFLTNPL